MGCFGEHSKPKSMIPGWTVLDFSMDETDPLNDLPDFITDQDTDIIEMLTPEPRLTLSYRHDLPISDDLDDDDSPVDLNGKVAASADMKFKALTGQEEKLSNKTKNQ